MFDKRLMKLCPESRKYIAGNVILQWLELGLNAVMILCIALAIDQLRREQLNGIFTLVIIIACTIPLRAAAAQGATKMSYLASRTVKRVLRERIYGKLLRLGVSYREHANTAELVQESVEGVEQLESYFGQYLPQFFYAFIAPLTLFVMVGSAGAWGVAAVLLVCVPLIPAAIMIVQKIAKKLLAKYWGQYTQLGSAFLENLQGMTTLKIYQADERKNVEMNEEAQHFRTVTMKVLTIQLNSVTIMDFVAYGGAALGIVLAAKAFLSGALTLSAAVFILLLSADFFLPMRRLGSYFHVAMNGMASSDRIFRFLALEDPPEKTQQAQAGEIRLENVRFTYDGERDVLHGVDLCFPAGGFTGIVGSSGSGKSTVAALILGRGTPCEGRVTLNGADLSTLREDSLMKTVTYLGFGSVFFKGTVRENLLLAAPAAADDALWNVLERCGLADFLRGEQGLETVLLENAGNLSGGQKQRLAFARALLHDSPVYIFDEATSNIDVESETLLLHEIKQLAKEKSVIMISHRLANVTAAQKIYCMEDGCVVGAGTHEQLLAGCGAYCRLWQTQQALERLQGRRSDKI